METNPPNPFKGLQPYKQEDQEKLFGRDRDLILMKDRVFSARTTLLFAGSGVGKTSFLNAKVIPKLKKQCSVVWHNRWTGADELELNDEFADDQGMRFWPPRALFRDLVRKISFWRDEKPGAISQREEPEKNDDQLSLEVRKTIAQSLRRSPDGTQPRLSQVLSCFRKSSREATKAQVPPSSDKQENDRCVLILDQFEEVFQYHAYEDYFSKFVTDLCEIINNDDYQVRVVFSMREEFLGELSIFDNKIPDLFNNYYRLKYPDKDEAEEIIRRTCELVDVSPDEAKLVSLVEDLSKIEKGGGSFAERSTGGAKKKAHIIRRNFVAPPYLQIACAGLWNRQYAVPVNKPAASSPGDNVKTTDESKTSYAPFLQQYRPGSDAGKDDEPGGDAQRVLRDFCEEKLNKPFLSAKEQHLAARAFGFLVTKQGAKMAYELSSLAEHMEENVQPLKRTLEKLSQDEAKILRDSRGPDRSYWFELYHDMYATIVDGWKIRYLKRKRRSNSIKLAASLLGVPSVIIVVLFTLFHWVINPFSYERELVAFKNRINGPKIEQQSGFSNAVAAFSSLKSTIGYGYVANSLWGDILERRAQWLESVNDPSSALLSLLKAAALESDPVKRARRLKDAEILLGCDNGSLLATYCDDCAWASLSPDGKTVLTMDFDGKVRLWNANSGIPMGPPFCSYCVQSVSGKKAIFSADGKAVLTAATVTREVQSNDQPRTQTLIRIQLWDTATQAAVTKPIYLSEDSQISATSQNPNRTTTATREPANTDTPDLQAGINIKAVARVGDVFWLAGVKGKQLYVWDVNGQGIALASMPDLAVALSFSADGQYLMARFPQRVRIWKLTASDVIGYTINLLNNAVGAAFSPNGRHLLMSGKDKTVRVIDLATGNILVTLPPFPSVVRSGGFSPNGEQFFTHTDELTHYVTQVWKTATGEPLFQSLTFPQGSSARRLGPHGATLLIAGTRGSPDIEKWDTQTGRLLGVIKRDFGATSALSADQSTAMIFSDRTARLWRVDSNMSESRLLQGNHIESADLSLDGKVLLTLSNNLTLQFWDLENGAPLGAAVDANASLWIARIADDGKYAAALDNDETIRVWQVGTPEAIVSLKYAGYAQALAFSSDDKMLAAAAESKITLWELSTGSEVTLIEQHSDAVNDLMLARERMISGSDDQTARIWNLPGGQRTQVLQHNAKVVAVALSPDAKFALTGCEDGTVRLWNAETGAQIGGEIRGDGAISEVAFSTEGRTFGVLTTTWTYLGTVNKEGLHYQRGALVADPWQPLFGILSGGTRLRFVYQLGGDTVQVQDLRLDGSEISKEFSGDPEKLLEKWEARFGLRISDLGQIEKMWQAEITQDDSEQSKQQKKQTR